MVVVGRHDIYQVCFPFKGLTLQLRTAVLLSLPISPLTRKLNGTQTWAILCPPTTTNVIGVPTILVRFYVFKNEAKAHILDG